MEIWKPPLSIRPLIQDLSFIKNKVRWGLHFMGGVKQLPKSDFEMICDQSP